MTCTAGDAATVVGLYTNVGTVEAVDPFGTDVSDTDPSHYTGSTAGIDVEKATNGVDADNPPGPFVPVGELRDLDLHGGQHRDGADQRRQPGRRSTGRDPGPPER